MYIYHFILVHVHIPLDISTCTGRLELNPNLGAILAQRAFYLALLSSLFGPVAQLYIYDHIVTNNIKTLLMG